MLEMYVNDALTFAVLTFILSLTLNSSLRHTRNSKHASENFSHLRMQHNRSFCQFADEIINKCVKRRTGLSRAS